METTYEKIKKILKHKDIVKYFPEGVSYSKAVPGLYENKKMVCFFLFYYELMENIIYPPYARIVIDIINKSVVYYYHIDEKKFDNIMPEKFISKLVIDDNFKEYKKLYENNFCKVYDFSFQSNLSISQKEILKDYKETFNYIIDDEIKPYYYEISPEFWKWMEESINNDK